MNSTTAALASLFGPVLRLDDVCGPCFGLSPSEASAAAAQQRLPMPAFRLRTASRDDLLAHLKAGRHDRVSDLMAAQGGYMVKASDLADFIDAMPSTKRSGLVLAGLSWADISGSASRALSIAARVHAIDAMQARLAALNKTMQGKPPVDG